MAGDDSREVKRRRRVNRERVVRTLTFWLRPEFVLRVVSRFQKVAGFDRAIALASGALTATIPLMIVISAVVLATRGQGHRGAHHRPLRADRRRRRGRRGHLRAAHGHEHQPRHHRVPLPHGRGAELHPRGATTVRAGLGAQPAERPQHVQRTALDRRARAVHGPQRRPPRRAGAHAASSSAPALLATPLTVVFLVWSGRVLSAKRLARQDLLPFAHHRRGVARGRTRSARPSTSRTSSTPTPPATA